MRAADKLLKFANRRWACILYKYIGYGKDFCVNSGETKSFQSGITLRDACKEFNLNLPYDVIAARVNNEIEGLNFKVYNHKDVEYLDLTSDDGMRVYVRSSHSL